MIGEKIAELRRQNNMSQEELAERLGISRQSVSKWESGQSLPDIEKLPILSDLFHVSIDYLVKEDTVPATVTVEPEQKPNEEPLREEETPFRDARFRDWQESVRKTFFSNTPKEETEKYILRKEEAEEFIALREEKGNRVSFGVAECVASVIPIMAMLGISQLVPFVSESSAAIFGVVGMFLMVAHAVAGFINAAPIGKQYEFLNKTEILPEYEAEDLIRDRCPEMKMKSRSDITVGVVLCILSVTPMLIGAALTEMTDTLAFFCVGMMFLMVAEAVRRFVKAGYADGTINRLMQKGEFSVRMKQKMNFETIYWSVITVVYVVYSTISGSWATSWLIWVIAGIAWPYLSGEKEEE